MIEGGTASNVVAGRCVIDGEARSIDEVKASETIGAMVDACTWAASEHGCDVDVEVREMFRGYRLASSAEPVEVARAALERCGFEPREVATGGGSDANALVAARLRLRAAGQRHRGQPHPRGERRGGADLGDARGLRGDR